MKPKFWSKAPETYPRLKKDLETKFLIRKEVEEGIKTLCLKNQSLADEINQLKNSGQTMSSDLDADVRLYFSSNIQNKNLKDRLTVLNLDLQDQEEYHRIELKKLKENFQSKIKVIFLLTGDEI